MMEYKFSAETIMDYPAYQDFQRSYIYAHRPTTAVRILMILAAVYYICNFDSPIILFGFLAVAAFYLISQLIQNRKGHNTQYKRMLLANNGLPNHSVLQFTQTQIVDINQDTGNTFTYSYDQIRYLIDAPRLILVVLDYRLCVIIQKNRITGGSPEELIAFLKNYCSKGKKKVRKITAGRWVIRILNGVLVAGCIFALMNLPGFSLMDKLSGKLGNDLTYQELAEQLQPLGIHISDTTIEELEEYDAQYFAQYHVEFYRDNSGASKVHDLLYWEGSGQLDQDTLEWTPSVSGIYWMDMEVWNVDTMYTDFLTGLDSMSDGITISNVCEDNSNVDLENGTGSIHISFELNDEVHTLSAWSNFDWFDMEVIVQTGTILEADGDARNLYVSDDGGQGLYFFYSDDSTARELSRLTGLTFRQATQVYSLY